jgi:NAD(P)H-dependent flavin oxidoreductase YrpB (nitropropane dioxygenase family)
MLKTRLCDALGIDIPIILAPMGTCTSAEFAAAVSNEGGLGGIGSLFRSTAAVRRDIDMVKKLTRRPFAINHIPQALDAEAPDVGAGLVARTTSPASGIGQIIDQQKNSRTVWKHYSTSRGDKEV